MSRSSAFQIRVRLTVAAIVATCALPRSATSQLPLDPLTPREVEVALRTVRADGRVRELVGARRSVVGATWFLALKPDTGGARPAEREPEPIRAAMVLMYVYEGDFGVRALVDVRRSSVLKVDRIENEPIPFAPEEIALAERLALREPRLRAALDAGRGETRTEWLGVTPADERDPCYKHRCIQLLFRRGRAFLMRPIVIVDLTAQTVRLEEPPR